MILRLASEVWVFRARCSMICLGCTAEQYLSIEDSEYQCATVVFLGAFTTGVDKQTTTSVAAMAAEVMPRTTHA